MRTEEEILKEIEGYTEQIEVMYTVGGGYAPFDRARMQKYFDWAKALERERQVLLWVLSGNQLPEK